MGSCPGLGVPHPGGPVGFGWPQAPEGSLSVGPWEAPQSPGCKCVTVDHCRILCPCLCVIVKLSENPRGRHVVLCF